MSITNLLENWSDFRQQHPSDDRPHREYKWAMSIDLDSCTGCNACSVACYAENNLPVVGKEKFAHGHSHHWIRIERYWDNDGREFADQGAQFLPMLCQHCESAPCETVCPVGATNHTADGLNSQVYNRCVGSRYCNANCPYKVRYFNWYNYPTIDNVWPEPMNQQLNPDVTVRSKGVMEKCTFCVQRLTVAKSDARTKGRSVLDGEVQTACQQVCPTGAISFGNLVDPEAKVGKQWMKQQVDLNKDKQAKDAAEEAVKLRGYRILEELRTYPSVMYLEQLRESAI
ncbi:4Fe-4S dicluster domain-containing protein [Candidatus Nitrotoga sp. 1052]|uniref:4Fe-4S dicluster domain-containing protein n=1 Tax=Candidatus Nitrotoga sp. 1052 TaxID=2886964 RepID=UPI001EF727E3|nr:4Fe-4S dicluster domain-containing protein [Candidatus Nitrotoga sp. 1052]CAH1087847.1 putative Menaquinol oxidoreductase complex ACIII, iron-sulfur cluster-binding subunit [Candidatus Nitrotoga sp. 1052]